MELNDPASAAYGNPVFDTVCNLFHSAAHYDWADLSSVPAALQRIADSDHTDGGIVSAMPHI